MIDSLSFCAKATHLTHCCDHEYDQLDSVATEHF